MPYLATHQRTAHDDENSIDALQHLLALLESEVRLAVEARRAVDPNPDDSFRGLYVADADVDRLLGEGWPALPDRTAELVAVRREIEAKLAVDEGEGRSSRLGHLTRRFGLSPLELDLFIVAIAPDLDSRYERLYGYLNDDVTRRRATIGLALELAREPTASAVGRTSLSPASALVRGGLIVIDEVERPFLTRSLRVPDRVAAHLLGDDSPSSEVAELLLDAPPPLGLDPEPMARALRQGAELVYLRERSGAAGRALAVAALGEVGLGALNLDLTRLEPEVDLSGIAEVIGRDARLDGVGIVAGPVEALGEPVSPKTRAAIRALSELPTVVILLGSAGWDPAFSARVPLVLDAPMPDAPGRLRSWSESLGNEALEAEEIAATTAAFRLSPEQVVRASAAARLQAAHSGAPLAAPHVRSGALAQNAAGLERMVRRIEPGVGWEDLVLPPPTLRLLHELVGRVRSRERVLGEWQMRPGGGRGQGVTALFAGDSGTGKTMSAEVVAGDLGLELYTINLATVVDKYIGETEKNLERIFAEVDGVNGVLLFDEAEALFGKRSEVKDAHDRYANIEVAYLLQRIETFDGLAILTTNLRANVDEAFTRRLDALVDFPFPDVVQRRILWSQCLGSKVPLAGDVDLEFLARSFELSGGNIRSIALTAAYLAAEQGSEIAMADLVRAVHREYRKLGRLSVRTEFGEWFDVLADETRA